MKGARCFLNICCDSTERHKSDLDEHFTVGKSLQKYNDACVFHENKKASCPVFQRNHLCQKPLNRTQGGNFKTVWKFSNKVALLPRTPPPNIQQEQLTVESSCTGTETVHATLRSFSISPDQSFRQQFPAHKQLSYDARSLLTFAMKVQEKSIQNAQRRTEEH